MSRGKRCAIAILHLFTGEKHVYAKDNYSFWLFASLPPRVTSIEAGNTIGFIIWALDFWFNHNILSNRSYYSEALDNVSSNHYVWSLLFFGIAALCCIALISGYIRLRLITILVTEMWWLWIGSLFLQVTPVSVAFASWYIPLSVSNAVAFLSLAYSNREPRRAA